MNRAFSSRGLDDSGWWAKVVSIFEDEDTMRSAFATVNAGYKSLFISARNHRARQGRWSCHVQ